MKKLTIYFVLALIFSTLTSCDFLRSVAGRPTSEQLAAKRQMIERREVEIRDSIRREEQIRKFEAEEAEGRQMLADAGFRTNNVFSFGAPLEALEHKYYVIIGVYRNSLTADEQVKSVSASGFFPSRIYFDGGIQAVVLCHSDRLKEIATTLNEARAGKVCPKDSWVYINEE